MTELIAFWTIVLVLAAVLATLREIYDDGLGRRQPPASHHPEPFDRRSQRSSDSMRAATAAPPPSTGR